MEFPDRKWSIPQAKMKARKKIRYPNGTFDLALTDPMIEILKRMWAVRESDYVFAGWGTGRHITVVGVRFEMRHLTGGKITLHGFRATVATWADDRIVCDEPWVKKMLLGHSVGSQTEQAYRRSDLIERRSILQEMWSQYLTTGRDLVHDIGAIYQERHNALSARPQAAQ